MTLPPDKIINFLLKIHAVHTKTSHRKDYRGCRFFYASYMLSQSHREHDGPQIDACIALGYITLKKTCSYKGYLRFTFRGLWMAHLCLKSGYKLNGQPYSWYCPLYYKEA